MTLRQTFLWSSGQVEMGSRREKACNLRGALPKLVLVSVGKITYWRWIHFLPACLSHEFLPFPATVVWGLKRTNTQQPVLRAHIWLGGRMYSQLASMQCC